MAPDRGARRPRHFMLCDLYRKSWGFGYEPELGAGFQERLLTLSVSLSEGAAGGAEGIAGGAAGGAAGGTAGGAAGGAAGGVAGGAASGAAGGAVSGEGGSFKARRLWDEGGRNQDRVTPSRSRIGAVAPRSTFTTIPIAEKGRPLRFQTGTFQVGRANRREGGREAPPQSSPMRYLRYYYYCCY